MGGGDCVAKEYVLIELPVLDNQPVDYEMQERAADFYCLETLLKEIKRGQFVSKINRPREISSVFLTKHITLEGEKELYQHMILFPDGKIMEGVSGEVLGNQDYSNGRWREYRPEPDLSGKKGLHRKNRMILEKLSEIIGEEEVERHRPEVVFRFKKYDAVPGNFRVSRGVIVPCLDGYLTFSSSPQTGGLSRKGQVLPYRGF